MRTSRRSMCGRRWKSSTRSRSRKSAPNLPQITILNEKKRKREPGKNRIPLWFPYGAEGGTRTPTGFPTTPSRWCGYQVPPLRHTREIHLIHGAAERQAGRTTAEPQSAVEGGCFGEADGE